MPSPIRVVLITTAVACLWAASPASAGTLSLVGGDSQDEVERERQVEYYSASGTNSVSISREGDTLVVTDPAGISAAAPCTSETPTRATCPLGPVGDHEPAETVYAFLGEGNDSVDFDESVTGLGAVVEGYTGRDVIKGTKQGDRLYGGSGQDRITARGGNDHIRGDGWAYEESEEPNHRNRRDVINAGGGRDFVHYGDEGHSATVIHLGGGKGEDALSGVEHATGTGGGDRITGSSARNQLYGEGGRDTIRGLRGDDLILAGKAREIACGRGADEVRVDRKVRPSRDCEHAHVGYLTPARVATKFEVADGQVHFAVACPTEAERLSDDSNDPCKDTLRLVRAAGGIAGGAKFSFQPGESGTVSIPLGASDRAALADGRAFSVQAKGAGYYNYGFRIPLAG